MKFNWLSVLSVMLLAATSQGAFVAVETFDALTDGNINGQNGWSTIAGTNHVVADPDDPTNKVLSITGNTGGGAFKGISIPQGTTATVFFRYRIAGKQNHSVGLSDVTTPTTDFGHYEAQLNNITSSGQTRIRDAGNFDNVLPTFADNTWYNIWIVVDNTADTSQWHANAIAGAGTNASELLAAGAQTAFIFRNGVANNNLVNFLLRTNTSDNGHTGSLMIDDIYIDNSGSNLTNPIPEPATLALTAAGGALLLFRRRK